MEPTGLRGRVEMGIKWAWSARGGAGGMAGQ